MAEGAPGASARHRDVPVDQLRGPALALAADVGASGCGTEAAWQS
jgi:hypothetical protein